MAAATKKADVNIFTGDTRVVERGKGDGLYINTRGIGFIKDEVVISPHRIKKGDVIISTGKIASHGMCIMAARYNMGCETEILSDTASLNKMIIELLENVDVHMMRDPTRGGVASALNEIAEASELSIIINDESIPVEKNVLSFCELLGFDPLSVANEGCMLIFAEQKDAETVLSVLRKFEEGKNLSLINKLKCL